MNPVSNLFSYAAWLFIVWYDDIRFETEIILFFGEFNATQCKIKISYTPIYEHIRQESIPYVRLLDVDKESPMPIFVHKWLLLDLKLYITLCIYDIVYSASCGWFVISNND